ncbi:MAG TPA: chemotaxis response regulator protein-glutamate methylesterase [Planctomycetaceae bacterium]|nr:chemotaxis response regulator protein-glutamate methylesterase [Planctomycetaceae bacterium]
MEDIVRILVVDDSALYRQLVRNVLREVPGVEVVAAAKGGREALDLVGQHDPDLLTLDVHMPDVDGIHVLRELKKRRVRSRALMLSSLTANGAQVTTDALLEGAFDFIQKPSGADAEANRLYLRDSLIEKIAAFRASRARRRSFPVATRPTETATVDTSEEPATPGFRCEALVVATSTGGPVALREFLPALPADLPVPVFVVQHMPPQYTKPLAERLNQVCPLEVLEAVDGIVAEAGSVYIAPGGKHLKLDRRMGKVRLKLTEDPPENGCRPAADYMFRSTADTWPGRILAVVLTGMGRDGMAGCRQIREQGGYVMAQHADGCIVYGMPKAVIDEKLAHAVLPLDKLAPAVVQRIRRSRS